MKKQFLKSGFAVLAIGAVMTSCGPALKITEKPLGNDVSSLPEKTTKLDKEQQKGWPQMDMYKDTVPGMSVHKAYKDIIKSHKGEPVIVAVLDAGVDINHEDLKDVIWTNKKEIPGNGIDDDGNGFVDDVHGWNFLGDAVHENLEYTRILKKLKPKYDGKSADEISDADKEEYQLYKRAKNEYGKEHSQTAQMKMQYGMLQKRFGTAIETVKEGMGGFDFTKKELIDKKSDDDTFNQAKALVLNIMGQAGADDGNDLKKVIEQFSEADDYFSKKLDYHLNLDYDGRAIVGDDVDDINDTDYGNNDVTGPTEDKEDILHGTHVSGIIAASRNNGIGMNGVANNVEIMPIRAVPDGDEYDKDIALGIRYAVDNGAKIINMSFGKYYSPHADWVIDAIKYAANHDVLLVNAAGNEGLDLDQKRAYPNDQWPGHEDEISDNVITVGALNYTYDENLVATFSNYGKTNVDVFAPGVQIWATIPLDKYKFLQGTSMAAPEVAGIAAMIRSYFPKLTAAQVKKVIMDSGLTTDMKVNVPHDQEVETSKQEPFNQLSKSGKMANLYNAMIMASEMSK